MRRQTFSFNFVFLFGGAEVSAWSVRTALSAMITPRSPRGRAPTGHAGGSGLRGGGAAFFAARYRAMCEGRGGGLSRLIIQKIPGQCYC